VTMTETIPPHGGVLVDLVLPKAEADRAVDEAEHLPKVEVGERELSDLEMLAVGALSPLQGFVGEKDYWSILREMHLTNGLPWTIPVTLSLEAEEAKRIGARVGRGALVARVFSGSPAQAAGLQAGDVITAVAGRQVDSREAFSTYTATIPSGQPLQVSFVREGTGPTPPAGPGFGAPGASRPLRAGPFRTGGSAKHSRGSARRPAPCSPGCPTGRRRTPHGRGRSPASGSAPRRPRTGARDALALPAAPQPRGPFG